MAKHEQIIHGDFQQLLLKIEQGILHGSISASLEDSSDFTSGGSQALFFKLNTWGEESFLNKLKELL